MCVSTPRLPRISKWPEFPLLPTVLNSPGSMQEYVWSVVYVRTRIERGRNPKANTNHPCRSNTSERDIQKLKKGEARRQGIKYKPKMSSTSLDAGRRDKPQMMQGEGEYASVGARVVLRWRLLPARARSLSDQESPSTFCQVNACFSSSSLCFWYQRQPSIPTQTCHQSWIPSSEACRGRRQ